MNSLRRLPIFLTCRWSQIGHSTFETKKSQAAPSTSMFQHHVPWCWDGGNCGATFVMSIGKPIYWIKSIRNQHLAPKATHEGLSTDQAGHGTQTDDERTHRATTHLLQYSLLEFPNVTPLPRMGMTRRRRWKTAR